MGKVYVVHCVDTEGPLNGPSRFKELIESDLHKIIFLMPFYLRA